MEWQFPGLTKEYHETIIIITGSASTVLVLYTYIQAYIIHVEPLLGNDRETNN
jgi:hypothetical protein